LFRLDLKSGASRLLTDAAALDPADFALLEGDRGCVYFDGRKLVETALGNLRDRVLYEVETGFTRTPGLSVVPGGREVVFIEGREGRSRLRRLGLRRRRVTTIIEGTGSWRDPQAAPRRAVILFRDAEGRIWMMPSSGRAPLEIRPPDGRAGPARLSPGGQSVLYLHYPEQGLHALREYFLSTRQDRLIARTSQFVGFAPNGDASVFVGASTGRAMPYILLMLRANGRELPLCEHRSSDPDSVRPVFSPDSRQVFFESDRDGRPALFAVPVEALVEATEQE
jgi:oligogalacturonide lyase